MIFCWPYKPSLLEGGEPKIWNPGTSPARQGRASLRGSECETSNGDWVRGKEWAGAVNVGSENRPYVVKGVKVHGQSMNECTPHRPASVLFFLMCSPPPSLSLLPSLSFCIMEYHCGAEIPSLTSAGLHNENKWAGSKYAGCVLFAALYQSAHRLSSKIKMDCVAKSP